jgi:RNA polymerase sigma-70 factor (ECF subfamily)
MMVRASTAVRSVAAARAELDELTVRRAQQGERSALEAVIERYQPMVHALVWRMACARGESHVADLVQDAFVRVLQGLSRFDLAGPARLSTWILTIATRVVLNDRRRADPGTAKLEPAAYIDPATAVANVEVGIAIAKAVVELPEPQRIAFVLREYHDLDYSEIAKALAIDVGTVKSRLSRARVSVRAALSRALPDLFGGAR